MDYRRVLAIDTGTRNFAWCVVDNSNWRTPLQWTVEDLVARSNLQKKKLKRQDLVDMAFKWCERNEQILASCDKVVLERQMRTPFIIMNTVIATKCFGKTVEVHPTTVGQFWGLPRDRLRKKIAGVTSCEQRVVHGIPVAAKSDDLADAWLMSVYMLVKEGALSKNALNLQ